MVMKYRDAEGDCLRIRSTKGFRAAVKQWNGEGTIKLYLFEKKKKVSKRQTEVLDTMIDAVITINRKGKVILFNKAAEEMFGYKRKSVLKKNVKMLMTPEFAEKHDGYLKNYLTTRNKKIIGIGREVTARHSDGHAFPVHLSVSESVKDGTNIFTGTMRKVAVSVAGRKEERSSSEKATENGDSIDSYASSMFSLLDALLDTTIVINEKGLIIFWNKAASEQLGYTKEEVMGKNIKICMPSSIGGKHILFF